MLCEWIGQLVGGAFVKFRSGLLQQQNVPGQSGVHPLPTESQARMHRHGSMIFLGQIFVLGSVPILDMGQDKTPLLFIILSLSVAIATVWSLGYQQVTSMFAGLSLIACLWILLFRDAVTAEVLTVPLVMFLVVKLFCAYLCIRQAFKAGVAGAQRIYCGAASFIMIGIIFAGMHGLLHGHGLGQYRLPVEFEGMRNIRWVDFIWFSYATLTTAGYSDLVPVGSFSLTVSSFEGLCGILLPATLIARIASLPANA